MSEQISGELHLKEYKVLQFLLNKATDEGVTKVDPEQLKLAFFNNSEKDYEKCISYLKTNEYIKVHHPIVFAALSVDRSGESSDFSGVHVVGELSISITDKGKAFLHTQSIKRKLIKFILAVAVPVASTLIVYWINKLLTQ